MPPRCQAREQLVEPHLCTQRTKEEDERVLQHAGEEELACHCRLRPHGGGAHGGCRGGSRSRARQARKPGADAESTFETLNATWILQGAIWVSRLM